MMETIAILFIFFILVFMGFVFYLKLAKSGTDDKIEQFKELSRMQIAQIASSLPELQCSEDNIARKNCIDWYKFQVANQIDLFAYSTISIQSYFPATFGPNTLYSRLPSGDEWSKLTNYFPISIYDPATDIYYFGVMVVEVYI